MQNARIADVLTEVADLLEIKQANAFRVRSYRTAARTVSDLSREAKELVRSGESLADLPGIGESIADKIVEMVETGRLEQLDELRGELGSEITTLLDIEQLGPKGVASLYAELGVRSVADLKRALEEGAVSDVEGFGPKTVKTLREEVSRIEREGSGESRLRLDRAEKLTEPLLAHLRAVKTVDRLVAAGSYRRRKETVGDLDILVTCTDRSAVMDAFAAYEEVEEVLSRGETRSTVVLSGGFHVDLRVVDDASYGSALHYFTGSKEHNVAIRRRAVDRDLKINEYGIFRDDDQLGGETEQDVYEAVDLPYIEPELRENRGEVEAAEERRLPNLVTVEEILGDLHAHTDATDGRGSLEEMAAAARERGYEYLAITDHSKRVAMANGLDADRLSQQIEAIARANESEEDFTLLSGVEVDILEDGSLDLPNDVLSRLDYVVCSVHYGQNQSAEEITDRVLRAMENENFVAFGHPTGRIIGEREATAIDMERVISAAKEAGCFLELNASPERLDLTDTYCRLARDYEVPVVIATDAHSPASLDYMRFGVAQARRGWLEAADVANTRSWDEVKQLSPRLASR